MNIKDILSLTCTVKQIEGMKYANERQESFEWIFDHIVKGATLKRLDKEGLFRLEIQGEKPFFIQSEKLELLPHIA